MGTLSGIAGPSGNGQNRHHLVGQVVVDGNGNLYMVGRATGGTRTVGVWKSTNDGDTWAEQDTTNRPALATATTGPAAISFTSSGTAIHILFGGYSGSGMTLEAEWRYATYEMSDSSGTADAFNIDELASTADWSGTGSNFRIYGCGIAVRSDGDVVITYRGADRTDMGASYEQVSYNVRTSGTWGTETPVRAENFYQQFARNVLGASDDVHMLWETQNSADPWGVTLDSADSLGTSAAAGAFSIEANGGPPLVATPAAGNRLLYITARDRVNDIAESSFPAVGSTSEPDVDSGVAGDVTATDTTRMMVYDHLTGNEDVYYFYPDNTDEDLYYTSLADGNSTNTWTTAVEAEDAILFRGAWGLCYTQANGDIVIGYVFIDNATWQWGEVLLEAGSTPATVTPAAIAGTTTMPASTVQTGISLTLTAVAGVATMDTPIVETGSETIVSPVAVAGATTMPLPTVSSDVTVTPTSLAGVATVPLPLVTTALASGWGIPQS